MKDILITLAIIAAVIYAIAVAVVPVHNFKDCCYCRIPVEIVVDGNHWHDSNSVICSDCWRIGRR